MILKKKKNEKKVTEISIDKSICEKNSISQFLWKRNLPTFVFSRKKISDKFINMLMKNGEKRKAFLLFSKAILFLQKKTLSSITINYPSFFDQSVSQQNFIQKKNKSIKSNSLTSVKKIDLIRKTIPLVEWKKEQSFFIKTNYIVEKKKKNKSNTKSNELVNNTNNNTTTNTNRKRPISYLLKNIIKNIQPIVEVRKVRVAGSTYQVPTSMRTNRSEKLAIQWILEGAGKRKQKLKKSFSDCLGEELVDAFTTQGYARQKRDELLKIAEANRAYIYHRWW